MSAVATPARSSGAVSPEPDTAALDLRGQSCWRVPVRDKGTAVEYRMGSPKSRIAKARNDQLWGPIVSAVDADGAIAKVKEIYPGLETGEPEWLHGHVHDGVR